jgi:uncharacterized protein YfaS (alpha-2-macroglobulin family)
MINQTTSSAIYRWIKILFSVVLISSLVAGCRLPWQPQDDTVSKEAEVVEAPQAPLATQEPRQDLPPALVEVTPLPNSTIALDQTLTLYFNQAMDSGSVEAAIHFDPRTSGRFTWADARTLTFSPDQPLPAGNRLEVAIDTSAQAANKLTLLEPIELKFQVAEPLQVIQSLPADGSDDIDPESIVFVAFNQPVVALGDATNANPGFTLDPEVPGFGRWLNTSTYVFTPDPSMNGGTTYTIELNKGLVATSGAGLLPEQQGQFSFTTTHPAVLNVLPMAEELLNLEGPIEVHFNMRMNRESVQSNFSLVGPGGVNVPGTFEWDETDRKVSFKPISQLSRNGTFTIQLGSEAESAGGLPIGEPVETNRRTYPVFAVDLRTLPQYESYYSGFGQFQLQFTTPIDRKTLDENISLDPEVPGLQTYSSESDSRLWINGFFQPETTYTLTLGADLKDIWGASLGNSFTTTFTTPPALPSLSLVTGYTSYNMVFVPASESEIILQATNIDTVSLEISPIGITDLITLLHPDNFSYREVFLPEMREVTTHQLGLDSNQREVIALPLTYQGEPLTPGVYYLGVLAPEIQEDYNRYQKYYLIVSENNLVLKVSPDQALIWATQLDDLTPLIDAAVKVYNTEGTVLTTGVLDADGLFLSDYERPEDEYLTYFALVGEPGEADFAFSISTWGNDFSLYEQGIQLNTLPALYDAYIYTDRPIYRPGDTIHFRTILFSRDNGLPTMPELDKVTVSINGDPGLAGTSAVIYSEELTLSRFGTVAGSAVLPEDAPTGFYWIDVSFGDEIIRALYFDVAAYRKPDIDLAVGFVQSEVLTHDDLLAEAQADYFFGVPVAGQSLSWTLYRKDAYFHLPGYRVGPIEEFDFQPFIPGYSPLGNAVSFGEGFTDDEGHVNLLFNAEDLAIEDLQRGQLQQYNLEVTVIDQSGFPVSFRDSILAHPENYYIGVQPDAFFGIANSEFNFSILTVDWDQEPISNVPIEAAFEAISWEVEETGNLEEPYRYLTETTFIGGASPQTDREGKASVSFKPPEPGTYRLTLESGEAVTQVMIWVTGEGAAIWPSRMKNQIDLTADANDYQPGQVAQVFIPNPFSEGAKAMVTTERGMVMSSQVLEITEAGTTLGVPITEESIPNIYVSVILMGKDANGKPDYRQGIIKLPVAPISKTLNVDLTLDPMVTMPGEMVNLTLRITDQQGNPVQGEFSVVVVDKAVLALVEPISPSIIVGLYREVPLSVQTSLSLKTYAAQLALTPLEVGGMGGGADRGFEAAVREDFPDTAFWQADVITGTDGTARLTIPLPDTLTTWVVEARGLTDDYLVGQAEADVVTQKPLMIQPVTPRFLVDNDSIEMAAVVHNNTDVVLETDVSLETVGFALMDSNSIQRVTIEPGQSQRVTWWGTVESVEAVDLVFRAVSGALVDASAPVWGDLQVKRYVMPNTFSTAGQLVEAGERLELVSLPFSTDPSAGRLSLVMNPSLLVTLVDGLKALESSPYEDTLSILSRLLANLNAYLVINNLSVDSPQLMGNLETLIGQGINQLLSMQNIDGGWSWWTSTSAENPSSDPFITAYVLLGLDTASEAGMDVDDMYITRAQDFLVFHFLQPGEVESTWMLDRLAFQSYAMRNANFDLTPTIDGLYARRSELSPWALGLLALTVRDHGGTGARVTTLISDLEGSAIRSATGVHWEREDSSWMLPGTPIFNTAVSVYTLAQLDPASTSLPFALRYLMAHRDSQQLWSSTFESAWVLMAVAKAMQGTGDYQADYDFQATINDVLIAEGVTTGPDSLNTITAIAAIDSLYPDSPNAVVIERGEGAGTLYYRLDLHTYQPAETAQAIHQGIGLQREYYLTGQGCPGGEDCVSIDSITLDPSDPSQFVTVALTLNLPHDMYNLLVEDFIPAGAEVLNRAFLTSQSLPETPVQPYDPRNPFKDGWGWWIFDQPQIYDDHVLWTADYVPAGTYILTYELLPYQRGVYQVLPAHAWQYFFPEVQGTSSGNLFTID